MSTAKPTDGQRSLYDRMLERQRAAPPTVPTTLAGRIRQRLGIAGLGEADMSLREVWQGIHTFATTKSLLYNDNICRSNLWINPQHQYLLIYAIECLKM